MYCSLLLLQSLIKVYGLVARMTRAYSEVAGLHVDKSPVTA